MDEQDEYNRHIGFESESWFLDDSYDWGSYDKLPDDSAEQEILEAIVRAQGEGLPLDGPHKKPDFAALPLRLIPIPTLPEFRYLFTCRRCRSHVVTHLVVFEGTVLRLCPFCAERGGENYGLYHRTR